MTKCRGHILTVYLLGKQVTGPRWLRHFLLSFKISSKNKQKMPKSPRTRGQFQYRDSAIFYDSDIFCDFRFLTILVLIWDRWSKQSIISICGGFEPSISHQDQYCEKSEVTENITITENWPTLCWPTPKCRVSWVLLFAFSFYMLFKHQTSKLIILTFYFPIIKYHFTTLYLF